MTRKKIQAGMDVALAAANMTVDEESALAARAAWLHFAGGKTQGEVAELLGVQSTKAHRLIAKARADGLIRVFVEGPIGGCIELEEQIKDIYGLSFCEVVPNIDEGPLPLRTLGMAGARFIRGLIEGGKHDLIGIGHGRTLAMSADFLPSIDAKNTHFVSLLGGLTRRFSASPFDVVHKLAERTGAEAYIMPVPFFANTVKDRQVLESQVGVAEVLDMARKASIYIAGIGEVDFKGFLATGGMVTEDDVEEVRAAGGVAEILGQFFREDGSHVPNAVSDRALAPRLADLKSHRLISLAGGTAKTQAIRAILFSKLLDGLITDEATAKRLVKTSAAKAGAKSIKAAVG
jgi:DNA-binding transcriptional regulator LsrR (DeoR family)